MHRACHSLLLLYMTPILYNVSSALSPSTVLMSSDHMLAPVPSRGLSSSVALVKAVLGPAQGDVDDGHEAVSGSAGAQQQVRVAPAQNSQNVSSAEAQVSRLCGVQVAKGPHHMR